MSILKWTYELKITIDEFISLPSVMSEKDSIYYIDKDTQKDILNELSNGTNYFMKCKNDRLHFISCVPSKTPSPDDIIWKFIESYVKFIDYVGVQHSRRRGWTVECSGRINGETVRLYLGLENSIYDIPTKHYKLEFLIIYPRENGGLSDNFRNYLKEAE